MRGRFRTIMVRHYPILVVGQGRVEKIMRLPRNGSRAQTKPIALVCAANAWRKRPCAPQPGSGFAWDYQRSIETDECWNLSWSASGTASPRSRCGFSCWRPKALATACRRAALPPSAWCTAAVAGFVRQIAELQHRRRRWVSVVGPCFTPSGGRPNAYAVKQSGL
jgi:hypothetical protein